MSEPLARLYDLALRTLDDQERRAGAVRSRLGPVLAAAGLGVTLLSGPVVGGNRPTGPIGAVTIVVALGGLVTAVLGAFRLLRERGEIGLDLNARELTLSFEREGALADEDRFYLTMIARLADRTERNALLLTRLTNAFTAVLCGILVMLCGLALAAVVG